MKKFILSLMALAFAAGAFAITPADPTYVSWYDSHKEEGFSRIDYTLPRVDTEGNELPNLRNLGFRVFTDNDQLFTFEASVYEDLPFDMTEIYYWIYAETGNDFNGDHTYFYRTNWEGYEPFFTWRIGIQAVYDDNGTKTYSNIVYHEVFPKPALPKPKTPKIDEWVDAQPTHIHPENNFYMVSSQIGFTLGTDIMGNPVADDYPGWQGDEVITGECTYTKLDPEKVTFSIFTDNDKLFEFTSDRFSEEEDFGLVLPTTEIPFGYDGYGISEADLHFPQLTNNIQELLDNGFEVEPFFTWRIGIQTHYTDNGQRSSSDIWYMEIFPQLKPASEVTTTSFLADWSCDAENTYMLGNFLGGVNSGYYLYVIDKATQDTVLVELVEPTYPQTEINEQGQTVGVENPIPGAFYTVEGLTPGTTYEYFVVIRDNVNRSYQSVVREVTLPDKNVYILGEVNDKNWAPNDGEPMIYDAENNVFTATVTLDGRNSGFNFFSFTNEIALYNDQGSWDYIAPFRFGALNNGDYEYNDEMNGRPLSLTYQNGQAFKVAAGEYKLTVSLEDMTLIIEKIPAPVNHKPGDVNHDGEVDIDDVTMTINYVLGKSMDACPVCANVNGDSDIDVTDVSMIINIALGKGNGE